MRGFTSDRPACTRAEWLADASVHVLGVVAALMAVPVLVTLAVVWNGQRDVVAASLIYSAALLAMLGCSAIYNITAGCRWTGILRRLDHTAIYIKIAGTYTPFAILTGAQLGDFLLGLWGAAAVGAFLKILAPHRFHLLGVAICLCMGWAGFLVADELLAGVAAPTFRLMMAGGILYTAGVIFFLWPSLPFNTAIWHGFVLVATGAFYAAVIVQLAHAPTTSPATTFGNSPLHTTAQAD
jgi:hemolysin III